MDFENIINEIRLAESIIELYDIVENIIDDQLRYRTIEIIENCELNNTKINVIKNKIIKEFRIEDTIENVDDFIKAIQEAANSNDLLNIIECDDIDSILTDSEIEDLHKIFRNNRFMSLDILKGAIIKYMGKRNKITESMDNKDKIDLEYKSNQYNSSNEVNKETDIEINNETNSSIKDNNFNMKNNILEDVITKRIGQQMSVAELNSLLQVTLNQYNKIYILESDLWNMDLDRTQYIEIEDETIIYKLAYDIIDLEDGIIEIRDITVGGK